jgi:hypothetical protein
MRLLVQMLSFERRPRQQKGAILLAIRHLIGASSA